MTVEINRWMTRNPQQDLLNIETVVLPHIHQRQKEGSQDFSSASFPQTGDPVPGTGEHLTTGMIENNYRYPASVTHHVPVPGSSSLLNVHLLLCFPTAPLLYRSTSPSTISIDPMMATRSASNTPRESSGSTLRLQKLGPRALQRKGWSLLPSAMK